MTINDTCLCGNKKLVQFIGEKYYRCTECSRKYLKKYAPGKEMYYYELIGESDAR